MCLCPVSYTHLDVYKRQVYYILIPDFTTVYILIKHTHTKQLVNTCRSINHMGSEKFFLISTHTIPARTIERVEKFPCEILYATVYNVC